MDAIKLIPDADFVGSGVIKNIYWQYKKFPHMVIFGSTGSGKTYLLKIILGRIGKYIPDAELVICDYKSDEDFSFLDGSENFYRFDRCMQGLEYVLKILQDRQHGIEKSRNFVCLVFDEWASFLNGLDKKTADHAKQCLSVLLMLGRSFNIHVIVSQQRLDASYFSSSRDNFSLVIGMGALSKESVEMMFSSYKDIINRNKSQGYGSMITGNQFKNIIVPKVQNINLLHHTICMVTKRIQNEITEKITSDSEI